MIIQNILFIYNINHICKAEIVVTCGNIGREIAKFNPLLCLFAFNLTFVSACAEMLRGLSKECAGILDFKIPLTFFVQNAP